MDVPISQGHKHLRQWVPTMVSANNSMLGLNSEHSMNGWKVVGTRLFPLGRVGTEKQSEG